METIIVVASYNMMHSVGFSKNLPMLCMMISKSTNSVGFQGQPPIGSCVSFRQARRGISIYSVQPGNPPPPTGDSWQQWIFGIIATIIVPFLTTKWSKLLKIKDANEVDTVMEGTEKMVDCVEEVAEMLDKVAKDVEVSLPQDGKWREAAVFVQGVAEEISKEAYLVEDFLHEVEKVEEKVKLLVDSVKDESKNVHHEKS